MKIIVYSRCLGITEVAIDSLLVRLFVMHTIFFFLSIHIIPLYISGSQKLRERNHGYVYNEREWKRDEFSRKYLTFLILRTSMKLERNAIIYLHYM